MYNIYVIKINCIYIGKKNECRHPAQMSNLFGYRIQCPIIKDFSYKCYIRERKKLKIKQTEEEYEDMEFID